MEKIRNIQILILDENENCFCYILLFVSDKFSDVKNLCILSVTTE